MTDETKFIIDDNKSLNFDDAKKWDKARASTGKLLEKLIRDHIEQIKPSLSPDKQALLGAFMDTKLSDFPRSRFAHMWLMGDELTLFQRCFFTGALMLMWLPSVGQKNNHGPVRR